MALATAWLEVRVLPGPPPNKIKHLAGLLAAVATVIGDSRPERQASYTGASRILRIVMVTASSLPCAGSIRIAEATPKAASHAS
jgi:hypothetical protein